MSCLLPFLGQIKDITELGEHIEIDLAHSLHGLYPLFRLHMDGSPKYWRVTHTQSYLTELHSTKFATLYLVILHPYFIPKQDYT